MTRTILSNLLVLLSFSLTISNVASQGLEFHSSDELIENRTSFNVFAYKTPKFTKEINIEFDLMLSDTANFGYILHIKDKHSGLAYDLTYTADPNSSGLINLSTMNTSTLRSIPIENTNSKLSLWHHIYIHFDINRQSLSLAIDNDHYIINDQTFNEKIELEMNFGKYESCIDVPNMSIRNLNITGDKHSFSCDFNESTGEITHDHSGAPMGLVKNPIWLINKSFHWKKIYSMKFKSIGSICHDQKNDRLVLLCKDSIKYYSLLEKKISAQAINQQCPVPMRLGTSFIDNNRNRLYVYEVNDIKYGSPSVAYLDLKTLDWHKVSFRTMNQQKHHTTNFVDMQNGKYYILGGYGNNKYSNELCRLDLHSGIWDQIELNHQAIAPRFFAGGLQLDSTNIIAFGGYGNPSGKQSAGKLYYNDCYKINIKSGHSEKLWESNNFPKNLVSSRSMILSSDSSHFFTLCYPEYLSKTSVNLYKLSLTNGNCQILADSIPMVSEHIRTNTNLYQCKRNNELFCIIQEFELDGSSQITIHSLNNPPVSLSDFYHPSKTSKKSIWIILASSLALILTIVYLFFYCRGKSEQRLISNEQQEILINTLKKNSIFLLGQFTAIDNKGSNITHLFSPKIKHLFLLILLKKENGVTSSDIYAALWPDREKSKAMNSKSVTINHLRNIISDIDGIELVFINKHWVFNIDDRLYCDVFEFTNSIEHTQNKKSISKENILLLSRGKYLEDSDSNDMDEIKNVFETLAMNHLLVWLHQEFKSSNYDKAISLAQIIYNIDPLCEFAFHCELISYYKSGKTETAKRIFSSYILHYSKDNNSDFHYTFRELVKGQSKKHIKKEVADGFISHI